MATPITFGLDLSHHQDAGLDLAQCKRDGIGFVFLKSSEGASFVDAEFAANLAEARAAGLLVAAYHYVRSNASAAAQVANVARAVPRDVPVIPDIEANSGGVPLAREFIDRLRAAGYRVPLTYIPRWYWQQLGSPSLAGLPPLWSSRYPDNVVGSLADEWADVPAGYWAGYGGLDVAVLQFTSSVRIAGHAPLDANAFRGTPGQLAALLGYDQEEEDVKPFQDLMLAREAEGQPGSSWPKVYAGNGVTCRHVQNELDLTNLQFRIEQAGGDPTVQEGWAAGTLPGVLGVEVGAPAPVALDAGAITAIVDQLVDRLGSLRFEAQPPEGS
ncbi:glycoside hydrolase family 25 protein [Actinophytocola sp.]|uniref:glycoside hydrolase family 25 protein n=1 Tax=Actinophytocola sp. TaxID=1872138 RepID=UPI002D57E77B|nr:glycoside hydrolase family 25 protein [Actinophytocola sp.]HYQ62703.1 glycoside hydrolase family 25 protein [Actinophytocola sp.]